jgi:hypothetical protein
MARHDFRCADCGTIKVDVDVPCTVGASRAEVYCPACDADLSRMVRMTPIPAMRISLFSDADPRQGSRDFTKFTTPVEDPSSPTGFRDATVSSLADIRRLERESEQAERNGEGRRMVWRDYAQDASNKDQHTLGEDPSLKPDKHYTIGTPVRVRRGDPVTADHGTVED